MKQEPTATTATPHWIGLAGLHGYLPSTCGTYKTARDAAEALADTHQLGRNRRRELIRSLDGSGTTYELSLKRDGNEYLEISPCYCDSPDSHDDE